MVSEVSILIPVFNQDVTAMVHTLIAQCKRLAVRYEILLYDDGSDEDIKNLNRLLAKQKRVIYFELPENIGRAAIRNRLAQDARYDYLLMLDNDCLPVSPNFLYNYLVAAPKSEVVIGGIAYVSKAPDRPYRLHWKYGKVRGSKNARERQKNPYGDIYLCNALVRRDIFLHFPLREKLKRYGHEDTVFAQEMRQNNIHIKHIQNPVIHLGLEQTPIMLAKTYQAVDNLVQLYHDGEELEEIKLVKVFEKLNSLRLVNTYTLFFSGLERAVRHNLKSSHPNLLLFDLYRLYLFGKKVQQAPELTPVSA
ncbi:glycosyltransferase involved in cell wall biosynthesis [Pontibacter aydingkolensis]|uniref:Glycosyltransferase n=1 Tax=Pontibacter aydingkolensis TaxID=1911536 RepID=A0ABS7CWK1_9BACT|nr:glycosyltransferase family 2 protein [Pontibacter aydingkolensis]MBW7467877.1 glycosyltransferase [Pontibacter aydingkolensis]